MLKGLLVIEENVIFNSSDFAIVESMKSHCRLNSLYSSPDWPRRRIWRTKNVIQTICTLAIYEYLGIPIDKSTSRKSNNENQSTSFIKIWIWNKKCCNLPEFYRSKKNHMYHINYLRIPKENNRPDNPIMKINRHLS